MQERGTYIDGLMKWYDFLSDMMEDLVLSELVNRAVLVDKFDRKGIRGELVYFINVKGLHRFQQRVNGGDLRTVGHI